MNFFFTFTVLLCANFRDPWKPVRDEIKKLTAVVLGDYGGSDLGGLVSLGLTVGHGLVQQELVGEVVSGHGLIELSEILGCVVDVGLRTHVLLVVELESGGVLSILLDAVGVDHVLVLVVLLVVVVVKLGGSLSHTSVLEAVGSGLEVGEGRLGVVGRVVALLGVLQVAWLVHATGYGGPR